jgi:hypothetical protein
VLGADRPASCITVNIMLPVDSAVEIVSWVAGVVTLVWLLLWMLYPRGD